jgi:hypothetical protein
MPGRRLHVDDVDVAVVGVGDDDGLRHVSGAPAERLDQVLDTPAELGVDAGLVERAHQRADGAAERGHARDEEQQAEQEAENRAGRRPTYR